MAQLFSLGVRATRPDFMKHPTMTVGDLRREIKHLPDDWDIVFTFDGNPVAFNMSTVRGRAEISGQQNLLQIAFVRVEDSK